MRFVFPIVLLTTRPALAQGIMNSRDAGGNFPRDEDVSANTIQPHALPAPQSINRGSQRRL
jgi:hypothetical protein